MCGGYGGGCSEVCVVVVAVVVVVCVCVVWCGVEVSEQKLACLCIPYLLNQKPWLLDSSASWSGRLLFKVNKDRNNHSATIDCWVRLIKPH